MPAEAPKMLDLSIFKSIDDALERVEPRTRYQDAARPVLEAFQGEPFDLRFLFFCAVVSRCEGLHRAIAREARAENPHAVFPLLRSFAETVVMLIYAFDHPEYIEALTDRPSEKTQGRRGRKSAQALINHALKHASGMKNIWAELSEASHFGTIALWTPFSITPGEGSEPATLGWGSAPRWKRTDDPLIVCAQTLELADGAVAFLRGFAVRHLGFEVADSAS